MVRWLATATVCLVSHALAEERPVVVKVFRRSTSSGRVDLVGQRPEPDGEPDLVFELVVEGDFVRVCVRNDGLSVQGCSIDQADGSTPPPGAVPLPGPRPPPVVSPTKHAPHLFVYDAAADAGALSSPFRGGLRTLRLHTWAPSPAKHAMLGSGPWRLLISGSDGSMLEWTAR